MQSNVQAVIALHCLCGDLVNVIRAQAINEAPYMKLTM
jgi:hypothetical protein